MQIIWRGWELVGATLDEDCIREKHIWILSMDCKNGKFKNDSASWFYAKSTKSLTPEPLKNSSRFSRQTDYCISGVILMLFIGTSSNYFTPGVNIIKRFFFDTDSRRK